MNIVLTIKVEGYTAIMTEDKEEGLFTMSLLEKGGPIISGKTKEECLEKFNEALGLAIAMSKLMKFELDKIVDDAIAKYPDKVVGYKSGNTGLIGLFIGEAMKMCRGAADPKELNRIIKEKLDKR